MKPRVLRSALNDLAAGRRFYNKTSEALGSYFFDSVFADIDSLVLYAGIHRILFGHHRLLTRRFPFAVYYRVIEGEPVVFRVLDCRMDPNWIRSELHKSA